MDAPNQALEKMVGMIGLPCKYGARGCSELVFLPSRLQHETLCRSQKNEFEIFLRIAEEEGQQAAELKDILTFMGEAN